ncbi:MAG: response regulator, partial [Treponema sp.]|nr:response regulator [Treponema sp.]
MALLALLGLLSLGTRRPPALPFGMKNLKMSFYLLFALVGLAISLISCLIMYFQYSAYGKESYFDTLDRVTVLVETQYPVLRDTAALKRGAANNEPWFWETSRGLGNIAASFNLARIYYIERNETGWTFLMASDVTPDQNIEWLGGPVWLPTTPVPEGMDEAYDTQKTTFSPKPTVNEYGTLVSAKRPIVVNGKTVGLLGAAYYIDHVNSLLQRALIIMLVSFGASAVIAAFLALAGSRQAVVPIQEWERIAREAEEHREKIASLADELKSTSRSKSVFLANISHEMRTPMNAIIGLSSLMLGEKEMPEQGRENLALINDSGLLLLGVINDILDINKLEAGKLELAGVRYRLPDMLHGLTALRSLGDERAVRFELRLGEHLPLELFGDKYRVTQMCRTLLENAFKFTKAGTVTLDVSAEREGGYVWLTLRVKDTGAGMTTEDRENLFSGYGQLDAAANRKAGGTGLGLIIVKRMAAMMDGGLSVESEYGKGSAFTLRLRQKFVDEAEIPPGSAADLRAFRYTEAAQGQHERLARTRLPDAKVLVVDDISTNLKVIEGILQPCQMRVDCVSSGPEAVARIRAGEPKYNLVLMDYMMPGMDGIETTRVIREEIGTLYAKTVPIVALTAAEVDAKGDMFLQNGFNAFLTKPIDITRLDEEINRW